MKIKTSELTGAALDWAVAKCEGYDYEVSDGAVLTGSSVLIQDGDYAGCHTDELYEPSTNWAQAGKLIEQEEIELGLSAPDTGGWFSCMNNDIHSTEMLYYATGPTPLIAAMRCYCCAKLGDEIDIPEELCQQQSS